jgi:hypothetical protein
LTGSLSPDGSILKFIVRDRCVAIGSSSIDRIDKLIRQHPELLSSAGLANLEVNLEG